MTSKNGKDKENEVRKKMGRGVPALNIQYKQLILKLIFGATGIFVRRFHYLIYYRIICSIPQLIKAIASWVWTWRA